VRVVTLEKPEGWITFDVSSETNEDGDGLYVFMLFVRGCQLCNRNHFRAPVYAYVLQILIIANHMSGKDTHVRGLRILGPIEWAALSLSSNLGVDYCCDLYRDNAADDDPFAFKTLPYTMYETIR
jgi:anaphase-promoting complex subunit 10